MNGSFEERMGGMRVGDKVCLHVVSTSSLLSCDNSQPPLVDETPREGIYGTAFLLADEGGSEKASLCTCCVSSAHS